MPKTLVDAETSLTQKKERKARTKKGQPNYNSVESDALKLSLSDRADLCKRLKISINGEVQQTEDAAKQAKEIAEGI